MEGVQINMKIIALEGLDKAGKASQTKLLHEYLITLGFKVEVSSFHRYDTPTGQLIRKWLTGEYDVSQATIELLMSADKQAQQDWFDSLEVDGVDFLILDRYTASQIVYAEANGLDPLWTIHLQRNMRRPLIDIYIDITPEESMARKGKFGENDRYESDLEMLRRVRDLYRWRCNNITNNIEINGMQPVEDVHADILKAIQEFI